MKRISCFDKKILDELYGFIGIIGTIASIISLAVALPGCWKLSAIFVVGGILSGYGFIYYRANKVGAHFRIRNIDVNVVVGDIFSPKTGELSVIPVNEYFDTHVDDVIIAKNTLHGKYILLKWKNKVDELERIIANDSILAKGKLSVDRARKKGNKQKYKLGRVIKINNFVLTSMTHFDIDNKAHLEYSEYIEFLFLFWNHIDEIYAGKTINIPVFGSGITRICSKKPSMQQLLETILWSLRYCNFQGYRINIIIYEKDRDKIDFYHLEPKNY